MTLRLDADVLAAFKKDGEGWQTRINAALRGYVQEHRS
ncbi:BrnA antitoxin family protein [Pseudomonas lopnurensis]|nr:BrnA antitoxin family protein [Pseudomonas lopnurensis]MBE7377215.1 BrnA antitoxin family protein [Pseudomonas lopnurensis]